MELVLAEMMKIRKLHVKALIITGNWCKNKVQMEWSCGRFYFLKG
jgi:hypothetical protein